MTMHVTRRDLFTAAAGTAAGLALSPAPWMVLDDLAIWTQNWSWIPRPPRGPESWAATRCALCPAGCPIRVRSIGGQPVSVRPAAGSAICALGLTGHHLAYHPARPATALRVFRGAAPIRTEALTAEAAIDSVARAFDRARQNGRGIAVLDLRPGRAASWAWRSLLGAAGNGVVIPAPGREGASLSALGTMIEPGERDWALDLDSARAIVSFGAPIAEGWGSPRLLSRILDGEVQLVQVEPVRSRTAEVADAWIAARPGTEAALALGIGHVLLEKGLADPEALRRIRDLDRYRAVVAAMTPERVAATCGIASGAVVEAAHAIAGGGVAVPGEDPAGGPFAADALVAILGLNVLTGGAIFERRSLPDPFEGRRLAPIVALEDVPDGSIDLLVVDGSAGESAFPGPMIERKLCGRTSMVVALAPFFAGAARRADLVLPASPFLETLQEIPTPFDAAAASLAMTAARVPAREGMMDAAGIARALAESCGLDVPGAWRTSEDLVRARVERIHAAGAGSVRTLDDALVPLSDAAGSPDELWNALLEGARWEGERRSGSQAPVSILGAYANEIESLAARREPAMRPDSALPLQLLPRGFRDVMASAAISPVFTKLYRESGLRPAGGSVVVHPRTAAALGLEAGARVRVETASGAGRATLAVDSRVMPDVVVAYPSPDAASLGDSERGSAKSLLDLCGGNGSASWRATPARLVEA